MMEQSERRKYLIQRLIDEEPRFSRTEIPASEYEQKRMLRALMNVRMPASADEAFLRVQDEYLSEAASEKGIVRIEDLKPVRAGSYIWRGDITRLAVDAIVNAANSGMTGCYQPNHNCIDNCIHTFAGVQLRLACAEMMSRQGHEEEAGGVRVTPAFNLPSRYVMHTVGPIIYGSVTEEDERTLGSCYRSCLEAAEQYGLESIAFCCISTGVFRFPNRRAAEIAVETVEEYRSGTEKKMEVVFNVFSEDDERIYREILG